MNQRCCLSDTTSRTAGIQDRPARSPGQISLQRRFTSSGRAGLRRGKWYTEDIDSTASINDYTMTCVYIGETELHNTLDYSRSWIWKTLLDQPPHAAASLRQCNILTYPTDCSIASNYQKTEDYSGVSAGYKFTACLIQFIYTYQL